MPSRTPEPQNAPLGKIPLHHRRPIFFITSQVVDASRQTAWLYDERASGPIIYAYVGGNPVSYLDPLGLYDWQDFGLDALQFTAGLGNAITFGGSTWVAKQFLDDQEAAALDRVQRCSAAFKAGEWASLALGGARLAYAGLAKVGAMAAADGAAAMTFRNTLKRVMRGPLAGSNYRIKTYEELMARYGSDEAIKAAAGRTNLGINALGAEMTAGGAAGLQDCECQ